MKKIFYGLLLYSGYVFSQNIQNGHLSGNFQSNSQLYYEDENLGITSENLPNEKFLINSFANLLYSTNNFSAGMRYEANHNVLLGFDKRYNGIITAIISVIILDDNLRNTHKFFKDLGSL